MSSDDAKPILFSGGMIRAILDGRKSQTRRLIKPQPTRPFACWPRPGVALFADDDDIDDPDKCEERKCPYGGVAGDQLWVRETWGLYAYGDETDWFRGPVRGCSESSLRAQYNVAFRADWGPLQEGCFWRPGIFMPRWASRITLELTAEPRVQRIQDITEDDARAEVVDEIKAKVPTARDAFRYLWDEINEKRGSWESNPWVIAIRFRRVKP